ncbi:HEPN domain-containing protein [Amycolatopsis thermoflava]|uniref:HEPN domain-containing protein n=1 Tax=Amycolatopsis thermoflava TaxID=84480 RepID=UPI0003F9F8C2|nr:HEPN domain-containing protein [Amycolatopsis thermoflava]
MALLWLRGIHAQHDDDFPPTVDGSAALSTLVAADISRPTQVLTDEQAEAVCEVYEMLGNPGVRQDRLLQVALRRFVFAGSKAQPEDRLLDLVICCEALFLKRHGIDGPRKGRLAAANAARLLADDPLLNVGRKRVGRFVEDAYLLRNAEVHGDHAVRRSMALLRGATTEDLARFVEDLRLVVGRALRLVLSELSRPAAAAGAVR